MRQPKIIAGIPAVMVQRPEAVAGSPAVLLGHCRGVPGFPGILVRHCIFISGVPALMVQRCRAMFDVPALALRPLRIIPGIPNRSKLCKSPVSKTISPSIGERSDRGSRLTCPDHPGGLIKASQIGNVYHCDPGRCCDPGRIGSNPKEIPRLRSG